MDKDAKISLDISDVTMKEIKLNLVERLFDSKLCAAFCLFDLILGVSELRRVKFESSVGRWGEFESDDLKFLKFYSILITSIVTSKCIPSLSLSLSQHHV